MSGLQSSDLVMIGFGIQGDQPPNKIQPPLRDGVHLRWAFRAALGFPWHGFYLFRRFHRKGTPICLHTMTSSLSAGAVGAASLSLPPLRISSERDLVLTDDFPPFGVEFDLRQRRVLRVEFDPTDPVRRIIVSIGFRAEGEIAVRALGSDVLVAEVQVSGKAGDVVETELEIDMITAVEVHGGSAALIDLCYVPVSQDATEGWEIIPQFPYPLCLPVAHPAYPCPGGPANQAAAETLALGRVVYGPASAWGGTNFNDLHDQLSALVQGGPSGPLMAQISSVVKGVPVPKDPKAQPPQMPHQRPLDTVLLGALHPALAQILGLYWVDERAESNVAYDYLLIGDWYGLLGGDPKQLLALIQEEGFLSVLGTIAFNLQASPRPPQAAPKDPRAYALPGGFFPDRRGKVVDAQNLAGLRWDLGVTTSGVLSPGKPVMYHLWRADLGATKPTKKPGQRAYRLITRGRPILVVQPEFAPSQKPERPDDWPPFPLHAIDRGLQDGWYSYQLSGIDIFGRHSQNSTAVPWYQWSPEPKPRPWYYKRPSGAKQVHPFAVRLLDKIPPPPPTAVEAYALDPDDPYAFKDRAYKDWLKTLSAAEKTQLIGLRVRWEWTHAHMQAAPDTHEFRIYYRALPASGKISYPDLSEPTKWDSRMYVVGWNEHVKVTKDAAGRDLRIYEVFLPAAGDTQRKGLPLAPTLAHPIAYAQIGVSAADDKTHTSDATKWSGTTWSGRHGNEGKVAGPVRVFRVHRVPPTPPKTPPDSEKLYATPADYHGNSFYTYRWKPKSHLKVHVYRALDETLFEVDWSRPRPRAKISATDKSIFPDAAVEPRWTAAKRQQVAQELNKLNTFGTDTTGTKNARAYYRTLSNDSLRVLAGLPGNDKAFSQITIEPLDPNDSANANKIGPDNPPDFVVDSSLRAYVDTLPGEATNRYFYRAAYFDGAQNRSALSLASPPIYLPNVVPPRPPVFTGVTGGDCKIVIGWASNRESDLAEYHVYRADSEEKARDLRLMTKVHTENVPAGDPENRPAELTWTDDPVQGLVTYYYCLVAVDDVGNISTPSEVVATRAYDESQPTPPKPSASWVQSGGKKVAQLSWTSIDETLLQRREAGSGPWIDLGGWRAGGPHSVNDPFSDPTKSYEYRLWARKVTGAVAKGAPVKLAVSA